MGRKRLSRQDLPRRVYFDHGAYYFKPLSGPKVHMGREYATAIAKYAQIVQPATGRVRLTEVIDAYSREKIPLLRDRTRKDYLDAITHLRPVFGSQWPEDLEPKHVYQYLRERGAPVRANREVAVLSNVMQQAIEMGLINANPCRQVRRNKETPRTREVTQKEVNDFRPHCPGWLQAYIDLKLLTGLRQGDMLRLGLFNIREDGLFADTSKSGGKKRLLFGWTDALRNAVEAARTLRRRPSDPRLFPISASGLASAWTRAMIKYGGQKFAEMDLRSKVADDAVELGLDATTMLTHSSDQVTRRHYNRRVKKVQPLR